VAAADGRKSGLGRAKTSMLASAVTNGDEGGEGGKDAGAG
jgi:hypothetical protein